MLRWLDLKNIFIWLGFSHFFEMLSFLDFFFTTRRASSGSAYACHVAWNLQYAHAHWSFPNSGRFHMHATWHGRWSSVPPPGPSDWREKKQPKKISKRKSRSWLLVKNSKRHNFTDTEWNHALQRGNHGSFKSKSNFRGRGFNLWLYPEFLDGWMLLLMFTSKNTLISSSTVFPPN